MAGKASIETHGGLSRRWGLLGLVLYPLAWGALLAGSDLYWYLPAGLRLGTLWLLPRKAWWKMAVAEWIGILAFSGAHHVYESVVALGAYTVLPWCIYALVLRGSGRTYSGTPSRETLPRLLAAGFVGAICTAAALTAVDLHYDDALPASLPAMVASFALGDFAGIVVLVPLMLLVREQWAKEKQAWTRLFAHGLVVAPLGLALGLPQIPGAEAPVYPLMLALFPLFAIAYRFGWRSGAIALGLLGVGVHFVIGPQQQVWGEGQLQLLLVVSGSAALLLGVASDGHRAQRRALTATIAALSQRGAMLAEASNRLSSMQEEERKRIGVELHDVLGQDITAIATRLRVVERLTTDESMKRGLASIGSLVSDAHIHLREVIDQMHPVGLEEFGLARALSEGPLVQMLRDQGMEYVIEIHGDIDTLEDWIARALYRICQEAANNCMHHVAHGRFRVSIGLLAGTHDTVVSLTIDDDGDEVPLYRTRTGRGLRSIADRAEKLGAAYRFNLKSGESRHALLLRIPSSPRAEART